VTVPKCKDKHSSKDTFTAKDWEKIRGHKKKHVFPKKYIICYFDYSKNYFLKNHKSKKIKLHEWLTVFVHNDVGFVKIQGAGAPVAAAVLEELIAVGGKYFINTGTAGGLYKTGVIVCNKALRDEGTSHHYEKGEEYAFPDGKLTALIIKKLKDKHIKSETGPSWTTDALFRETEKELKLYKKQGIYTVDMEASALFTVAKIRNAHIASVFVVSDVIGHREYAVFHRFDTRKGQREIIDTAYEVLKEIKTK
jgi:uridine phosphorylase